MSVSKESMLLYAITDRTWLGNQNLTDQVEEILKAGVTFLQLREKHVSKEEMLIIGKEVQTIARKYKVPFVINDDIMVAKELDADGVHIGQSDMEYEKARNILGDNKIIGISVSTLEQAIAAETCGADYIGVGAVFHTDTKTDASAVTYEKLKEIAHAVSIPVVAIGGINESNVVELKGTGIDGICVISAIFSSKDKGMATKKLLNLSKEITSYE